MYLPKRFENADPDRAVALMRAHPLATVISVDRDQPPFVSHLPLIVERRDDQLVIVGHLARANPHWKLLAGRQTTAIFHGPNAYITPTWYEECDVPTWNYAVVHVRGPVTLIDDRDGIVRCLEKLTAVVETEPEGWQFRVPDDLAEHLERHIVAFELRVESMASKFKLSQNRSAADREGVLRGLRARSDDGSRGILAILEELAKGESSSEL
jgi:transcriptional regulator